MSEHNNESILPKALRAKFTVHKEIGKGNYSVVRLCRDKVSGEEFVVKIIDKRNYENIDAMNEVKILKQLNHPNIIKYVAHEDTPEKLFLVTEYIKGTTLGALAENGDISRQNAAFIMVQLMNGLSYLHSLNIVHRDIAPNNLFVQYIDNKVSVLKIGDFGYAAKLKDGIQTGYVGTFPFIAPEISGMLYNFKVDVYSAGNILNVISPVHLRLAILGLLFDPGHFNRIELLEQDRVNLIGYMTAVNPIIRYSTADVLNHKWIKENFQR